MAERCPTEPSLLRNLRQRDGTAGRSWHSEPESGLYFSAGAAPDGSLRSLRPLFTLGTAVAIHNAIERKTGLDVDIKWPNDLLVDGKKVCGILAEMQAEFDRVNSLIIGIGVNVNHAVFPADIGRYGNIAADGFRADSFPNRMPGGVSGGI